MWLNDFQASFEREVQDLLWMQWAALGVRVNAPGRIPHVVDPEALLLLVWGPGRSDPRLFDTALAWSARQGEQIDKSRLKHLLQIADPRVQSVAKGWGNFLSQRDPREWQWLGNNKEERDQKEKLRPLFPQLSESLDARDESFASAGWARGEVSPQKGSIYEPDKEYGAAARILLRRLFGATARAELITAIFFGKRITTRELAETSSYSKRYIQALLDDFEATNLIKSTRGRGRQGTISPTEKALQMREILFGLEETRWIDTVAITRALLSLWTTLEMIRERELREYASESLLRDALDTIQENFESAPTITIDWSFTRAKGLEEVVDSARRLTSEIVAFCTTPDRGL